MEDMNKKGIMSDDELENISGGRTASAELAEKWRTEAEADGHPVKVTANMGTVMCSKCFYDDSIYAREKVIRKFTYDQFIDTKCYNCYTNYGNSDTSCTHYG